MGDTNHGAAPDNADDNGGAGQAADETVDDADTTKKTDANDDDQDGAGDGDGGSSEDGDDEDGKGDSDKETDTADDDDADDDEEEDDGLEPELRKPRKGASNAEWAAWRAQEKAKEARKKADDAADKSGDGEDTDEDGDDPSDADTKEPTTDERVAALEKEAADREVEAQIATFVKDNPDFAPFAKKAERFAKHPSRANLPIKSIFYEVAGDKLMSIGAKRAEAARKKAQQSQTGGGSSADDGKGSKSYKDMPLDQMEKEVEAVKLGKLK